MTIVNWCELHYFRLVWGSFRRLLHWDGTEPLTHKFIFLKIVVFDKERGVYSWKIDFRKIAPLDYVMWPSNLHNNAKSANFAIKFTQKHFKFFSSMRVSSLGEIPKKHKAPLVVLVSLYINVNIIMIIFIFTLINHHHFGHH